jgi:hypothetical protein
MTKTKDWENYYRNSNRHTEAKTTNNYSCKSEKIEKDTAGDSILLSHVRISQPHLILDIRLSAKRPKLQLQSARLSRADVLEACLPRVKVDHPARDRRVAFEARHQTLRKLLLRQREPKLKSMRWLNVTANN